MKTTYLCPHCRATLRVRHNIMFKFRTKNQVLGILILNPKSGNYVYIDPPGTTFEEGEKIYFMCPVCCKYLKSNTIHDDLVEIVMIDRSGKENHVYFSSKAGKHGKFYIGKKEPCPDPIKNKDSIYKISN